MPTLKHITMEDNEFPILKNIKQLTYQSMGFEKAGEAYFSPDNKYIAFQAVPTGHKHYQIYTLEIETGKVMCVSTGKGACTCAYFKPDNSKIIFASSHEAPIEEVSDSAPGYKKEGGNYSWDFTPYMNIYEANIDGSNLKPLTSGSAYHAECAYSSDGSQIVFASNMDGHMNLYVMNSDGSNVRQVTHDQNVYNGGSFFSPDGSHILYRADHTRQHYLQLYTINIDGSNRQQLTNNSYVNWAPYYHTNGEVIAYTTSIHGHHKYEIYLLNSRTQTNHRLTYNGQFNGLPSFSRDASKLVWTSKRNGDQSCQIYMADFLMPTTL